MTARWIKHLERHVQGIICFESTMAAGEAAGVVLNGRPVLCKPSALVSLAGQHAEGTLLEPPLTRTRHLCWLDAFATAWHHVFSAHRFCSRQLTCAGISMAGHRFVAGRGWQCVTQQAFDSATAARCTLITISALPSFAGEAGAGGQQCGRGDHIVLHDGLRNNIPGIML